MEPGETLVAALRRELREEVGLAIDDDPAHVWHQEFVAPGHADGYDGVANDYFLVRTTSFDPHGALSAAELDAEHISAFRWWRCQDIAGYRGNRQSTSAAARAGATPRTHRRRHRHSR